MLNTQHFRYGEEWFSSKEGGAGSAVLEFFSEIDGITINGIDIITWNAAGLITHFKVMVRPRQALEAVRELMSAALDTLQGTER